MIGHRSALLTVCGKKGGRAFAGRIGARGPSPSFGCSRFQMPPRWHSFRTTIIGVKSTRKALGNGVVPALCLTPSAALKSYNQIRCGCGRTIERFLIS